MSNEIVFIFGAMSDSSYDLPIKLHGFDGEIPRTDEFVLIDFQNKKFSGKVYRVVHEYHERGITYTIGVNQYMPDITVNAEILEEEAKRKNSLNDIDS